MARWFDQTIVDEGRLPLFFLLVAFVITFLFIRFSVRMIRAEVSWWPGNVTPGGVHVHHVFFGMVLMLLSGFGFFVVDPFRTPVADCILAALFGIGAALVLDEFALLLHLRDVYWSEEGRTSIDAVFVAIAIGLLFLMGVHPLASDDVVGGFRDAADNSTRIGLVIAVAINVALAIITLLKGKVWTGLIGLFFPFLLLFTAIRVARPRSPWARWRYGERPRKQQKALDREMRYREPIVRAKIVVQEAVAGRFGLPEQPAAAPREPRVEPVAARRRPGRLITAVRWRRTRRELKREPPWRLPTLMVSAAIVGGLIAVSLDDSFATYVLDAGTTATLLGVIAGAMATLTGLVFTAVTLAMQFGASQISIRVIPMLQQDRVMRGSVGLFLSTFAFTVIVAVDLTAVSDGSDAPAVSTSIAIALTLASAFMFIMLIGKVGSILNSTQLLRWIESQGRLAVVRQYPDHQPTIAGAAISGSATLIDDPRPVSMTVTLRDAPSQGRVLLAINLDRIQRLADRWDVRVDLLVGVGDYVPHHADVFEIVGDHRDVRSQQLLSCLLFGDSHGPSVSPAAALQAISDVALKALSPSVNDPSRAVQAIDHAGDLLLMLAPRVAAEEQHSTLTLIGGYRRTWGDYVGIATDQVRHFGRGSIQVQRRLRALYETLGEQCTDEQQTALQERLAALDAQVDIDWTTPIDRRLAHAADRQGYGSEEGRVRQRRLRINTTTQSQAPADPAAR
ncbi:DUF2254 domain-containing protein [Gordonia sp. HNM0687]|uniref:DUF2254 domain-containing protein n=1 Tax=Gordonia mangrovi TaxID=2665643 RepID=A0A6L7GNF4_9ACTN|nr:DUF2254 family protein [Gordonia mangrovi]MXP21469.1 DUF2254 domain-containing protein [Gordonia mangrovi]UVF80214.1 DUF2254 domain-containing protein [Gordonia mangrovi]